MTGCVSKFMKVVQREAARGFRCKLGTDFLTVYPNIQCSVKDELNPDKTVKKAAESKDVKANNAKSRLGCTVSPKYSLLSIHCCLPTLFHGRRWTRTAMSSRKRKTTSRRVTAM